MRRPPPSLENSPRCHFRQLSCQGWSASARPPVLESGIPTSPAILPTIRAQRHSCDTLRAVRTDGGSKKTVDDMEGLSMQTCSIKEEWMDLEDLDFDVVVDVFNNNNSDKGFQRQQSFLDILTDLTDYKDEEQGIDRAETAIYSDSINNNNASSLTGYSYYSPPSPSDSCFSTEGFPEEIHQIDQLLPFELPFERVNQLDEQVATSIDLEMTNKTEEGSEEEMEEQMEEQSDSDEDSVPEEYSILKMKSRRKSR